MEQRCWIACWSCTLVHPDRVDCDLCGGRRSISQAAQMADRALSHELLAAALARAAASTGPDRHDALVGALTCWQIYGVAYVAVEHGVEHDSTEHTQAHAALRDRLVEAIRGLSTG